MRNSSGGYSVAKSAAENGSEIHILQEKKSDKIRNDLRQMKKDFSKKCCWRHCLSVSRLRARCFAVASARSATILREAESPIKRSDLSMTNSLRRLWDKTERAKQRKRKEAISKIASFRFSSGKNAGASFACKNCRGVIHYKSRGTPDRRLPLPPASACL